MRRVKKGGHIRGNHGAYIRRAHEAQFFGGPHYLRERGGSIYEGFRGTHNKKV